jgi:hypothetical protein
MTDVSDVEQRTDLIKASSIEIGATLGGVKIEHIADLAKVADTLSRGEIAVPAHCRGRPGVCFALAMQALEWGLPIMSVINKSYVPRNSDRIGFESQLLHAVIEKNAPIKGRLRYEILGEGDERRCKIGATFKGEDKPHEYTSETLGKMHPGHVTKDGREYVKGSQLWDDNPEVQMFYSASRQWARLFCPDVLLGAYTPDELRDSGPIDVTPPGSGVADLAERLRASKAAHADTRGFNRDSVAREVSSIIEGDTNPGVEDEETTNVGNSKPDVDGRQGSDEAARTDHRDAEGSVGTVGGHQEGGEAPVGEAAARAGEGGAEGKSEGAHQERRARPKAKRK